MKQGFFDKPENNREYNRRYKELVKFMMPDEIPDRLLEVKNGKWVVSKIMFRKYINQKRRNILKHNPLRSLRG